MSNFSFLYVFFSLYELLVWKLLGVIIIWDSEFWGNRSIAVSLYCWSLYAWMDQWTNLCEILFRYTVLSFPDCIIFAFNIYLLIPGRLCLWSCSYCCPRNFWYGFSSWPTPWCLYQNMHGGYPEATLERFLRARDDNVEKASKMVSHFRDSSYPFGLSKHEMLIFRLHDNWWWNLTWVCLFHAVDWMS